MITIGICDDEPNMRKLLRIPIEKKLQLLGEEYLIYEFSSGITLLSSEQVSSLDFLFLDIEMPELSGMETARALRSSKLDTTIIFVTAYPDFVFQGYEVHAYHYILKPYEERKIMSVLEQAILSSGIHEEKYLTVTKKSGIIKVPFNQIRSISSDRRKLLINRGEECVEFYGKLGDIKEQLPNYFIQIHNRYLVNLNFVTSIEGSECICDDSHYPVSQTYRLSLEIAFAKNLLH